MGVPTAYGRKIIPLFNLRTATTKTTISAGRTFRSFIATRYGCVEIVSVQNCTLPSRCGRCLITEHQLVLLVDKFSFAGRALTLDTFTRHFRLLGEEIIKKGFAYLAISESLAATLATQDPDRHARQNLSGY